ncbi:hypothetical protein BCR33DRAFT_372986 [Rhizoclosmatium globosum]|uniref:Ion transport domain-containing protein n=1 Tax=Rhizoclosmatium globosum TaxID=329046 RepID=A0A1Y2BZN8_9FUNG|nr:hypothetical protein BCR33DRAFT_372986 [Rhizoclosmatium globosum]|eukprot:ORY40229.1 hypothetical protein BCR33DRAFT_372986 [Rhizoclosmatium globosum]
MIPHQQRSGDSLINRSTSDVRASPRTRRASRLQPDQSDSDIRGSADKLPGSPLRTSIYTERVSIFSQASREQQDSPRHPRKSVRKPSLGPSVLTRKRSAKHSVPSIDPRDPTLTENDKKAILIQGMENLVLQVIEQREAVAMIQVQVRALIEFYTEEMEAAVFAEAEERAEMSIHQSQTEIDFQELKKRDKVEFRTGVKNLKGRISTPLSVVENADSTESTPDHSKTASPSMPNVADFDSSDIIPPWTPNQSTKRRFPSQPLHPENVPSLSGSIMNSIQKVNSGRLDMTPTTPQSKKSQTLLPPSTSQPYVWKSEFEFLSKPPTLERAIDIPLPPSVGVSAKVLNEMGSNEYVEKKNITKATLKSPMVLKRPATIGGKRVQALSIKKLDVNAPNKFSFADLIQDDAQKGAGQLSNESSPMAVSPAGLVYSLGRKLSVNRKGSLAKPKMGVSLLDHHNLKETPVLMETPDLIVTDASRRGSEILEGAQHIGKSMLSQSVSRDDEDDVLDDSDKGPIEDVPDESQSIQKAFKSIKRKITQHSGVLNDETKIKHVFVTRSKTLKDKKSAQNRLLDHSESLSQKVLPKARDHSQLAANESDMTVKKSHTIKNKVVMAPSASFAVLEDYEKGPIQGPETERSLNRFIKRNFSIKSPPSGLSLNLNGSSSLQRNGTTNLRTHLFRESFSPKTSMPRRQSHNQASNENREVLSFEIIREKEIPEKKDSKSTLIESIGTSESNFQLSHSLHLFMTGVDPDGAFKNAWIPFISLFYFYTLLFLPWEISYNDGLAEYESIILAVVFSLDTCVNLITVQETDPDFEDDISFIFSFLQNLLSLSFITDVISSLPWGLIMAPYCAARGLNASLFDLIRMIRLFRFPVILKTPFFRRVAFFMRSVLGVGMTFMTVFTFFGLLVLFIHLHSCAIFLFGRSYGFTAKAWEPIHPKTMNLTAKYAQGIWMTVANTIPVTFKLWRPDTVGGQWSEILFCLCGGLLSATITGTISALSVNGQSPVGKFITRLDQLREYIQARQISHSRLGQYLLRGYYLKYQGKIFDEEKILSELNPWLRQVKPLHKFAYIR